MKELINFKGHFKIQSIDKSGKIVDEWEEKNLIMDDASVSMAKIFANLSTNPVPHINKFKLGTLGHNYDTNPHDVSTNILTPKTSVEGFVSTRDRIFSEFITVTSGVTVLSVLNQGDVVYNDTLDGTAAIGYYQYTGSSTTTYSITEANLTGASWDFIHASTEPYKLIIDFDIPGTTSSGGDAATITAEDDTETTGATGSAILVEQTGSSVIFHITIPTTMGNAQFGTTSTFTEASLYADNNSIFSMKTFRAKSKDSSVELRITWTITF